MMGKTEKFTLISGVAPALSGLVTAFRVDGVGHLRHLRIEKCENSGVVRLSVMSDSELVITNGQVALSSGVALPDIDFMGSALLVSGATLISGATTNTQDIGFTENLTVIYTCTSGSANITGIVDVNKMIIQT
jgi:hypothetical protein